MRQFLLLSGKALWGACEAFLMICGLFSLALVAMLIFGPPNSALGNTLSDMAARLKTTTHSNPAQISAQRAPRLPFCSPQQ